MSCPQHSTAAALAARTVPAAGTVAWRRVRRVTKSMSRKTSRAMILEAEPMSHISALGYLVVRGPLEPWRHFGTDVLGAQLVEGQGSGRIRFRTDEQAWRIEVQDGPPGPDALVALGFEVADEPALDSLAAELQAAAVPVKEDRALAG